MELRGEKEMEKERRQGEGDGEKEMERRRWRMRCGRRGEKEPGLHSSLVFPPARGGQGAEAPHTCSRRCSCAPRHHAAGEKAPRLSSAAEALAQGAPSRAHRSL
eukprot:761100-Hanusia_phi.AAC.2